MSAELQPGSVFANDFKIVRPLDEGGMGSVFVAEQLSTGNHRALKLMLPSLVSDAKLRERFLLESKVGSRIQSDHVVQVIAAGVEPSQNVPWLAMELLQGEELEARVSRDGPLSPALALLVTQQLCHALAAAHAVGVVHRDLKPKNLFLCKPRIAGAQFQLKVLDFGIAKVMAEAISTGTAGMGTPLWMAPEQTEISSHVGPETDLWALGLIVYWMLTGKSYWLGAESGSTNVQVILRELVMDPIVPASQRAAQQGVAHLVPPRFDAWLSKCLQRARAARFSSADVALAELSRVLGADAMHPGPPARPGPTAIQDEFTSRPTWADGVAGGAAAGPSPSIVVRQQQAQQSAPQAWSVQSAPAPHASYAAAQSHAHPPPHIAGAYAPPAPVAPPAAHVAAPPPPPVRPPRRTQVGVVVGASLVGAAVIALVVWLIVRDDKPKIARDWKDDAPAPSTTTSSKPRVTKAEQCRRLFAIVKDGPRDMSSAGLDPEQYARGMERIADRIKDAHLDAKDVARPAADYAAALRAQATLTRKMFSEDASDDVLQRALEANERVGSTYAELVEACEWQDDPPIPSTPFPGGGVDEVPKGKLAPGRPGLPCNCDPKDPLCPCAQ